MKFFNKLLKKEKQDTVRDTTNEVKRVSYLIDLTHDKKILDLSKLQEQCDIVKFNDVLHNLYNHIYIDKPSSLLRELPMDNGVSKIRDVFANVNCRCPQVAEQEWVNYAYELLRNYTNYINIFNTRVKIDDVVQAVVDVTKSDDRLYYITQTSLQKFRREQLNVFLSYWDNQLNLHEYNRSKCATLSFSDRLKQRMDYSDYLIGDYDERSVLIAFYSLGILRTNSKSARLIQPILRNLLGEYECLPDGYTGEHLTSEDVRKCIEAALDECIVVGNKLLIDCVAIINLLDEPVKLYIECREVN